MKSVVEVAVIMGVGPGLGAALGRRFSGEGMKVVLVSRNEENLRVIAASIDGAIALSADVKSETEVEKLIAKVESEIGSISVLVYNPGSGFNKTPVLEQTSEQFRGVWESTAYGGFLSSRAVSRFMKSRGSGTIIFTGATASIRGGAGFSAFAAGKFALRALSQSLAREVGASGIHVAHIIVDGGIGISSDDVKMDPDAIAETYYNIYQQKRSSWTHEIDLRPWVEKW
jgi:NAD(P)-dependent dehydrogenase (short-subunit alcohol dehydrogenase family)